MKSDCLERQSTMTRIEGITGRWRELYEIHGNGIPRLLRNQKLLEKSVGSVAHRFGVGTDGTQFAVVFDIDWKSRPIVVHSDLVKSLCLTKVTCKGVVMQVLKNTESEIARIRNHQD